MHQFTRPSCAPQTSLKDLFSAYANYGTRVPTTELDGAKYVKVFKDAQLLGKGLSSTDLDIIFSKVLYAYCSEGMGVRQCMLTYLLQIA